MTPSPKPGSPRRVRVLVVDDDLDLRESLEMVFEDLGHEVALAADGKEALAHLSSGRRFEVVLCDMSLPGLDGFEVAREIRAVDSAARIYLLTGAADRIPANDPRRREVAGVLAKPIEFDALERLVSR